MTKRFEYCQLHTGILTVDGVHSKLDNLGKEGWELAAILSSVFYLKREMPDQKCDAYEYTIIHVPNEAPDWMHTEELTKCGTNGWMIIKADLSKDSQGRYVMKYLLMRKCPPKFPIEWHPDYKEPAEAEGYTVNADDPNPPKGFIGHKVEGPDIEKINPEPIPAGVYYARGNFYDNLGNGMGNDFYREWIARASEFPKNRITANETKIDACPNIPTDYFDYSYFFNTDHVWIKLNITAARILIARCITDNVWCMYYPNTRNGDYPWLVVKKGMKVRLAEIMLDRELNAEVIPGQHMEEDKI